MASYQDYVGCAFGDFVVAEHVASGAEAEVFRVENGAKRALILRLDANDETTWEGEPVLPPRNASVELKNIRGSYFAKMQYTRANNEDRMRRDSPDISDGEKETLSWKFSVPEIYGVQDGRYLISLASPFIVKHSVSLETFLQMAPANDLHLFELWEDVALQLLSETYLMNSGTLSKTDWLAKWSRLVGGQILKNAISQYMRQGSLSYEEQSAVIAGISVPQCSGRELAENLLLRLCGCLMRGRLTPSAGLAMLRCKHFRANVTLHEIEQIVDISKILSNSIGDHSASIAVLGLIHRGLSGQPYDVVSDPDEFVLDPLDAEEEDFGTFIERHELARFDLFLQEYAGSQPYIQLERTSE